MSRTLHLCATGHSADAIERGGVEPSGADELCVRE